MSSSRRSFMGHGVAGGAALAVSCVSGAINAPLEAPAPPSAPAAPLPSWPQVFGTDRGFARLHKNENPYGPSLQVQRAIRDVAGSSAHYGSTSYLEDMIAERYRVAKTQVLIASGSVENLAATALAWGRRGTILCPDLFWDTTARYGEAQGATLRRVRLDENMRVNLATLEAQLDEDVSLVHLCNPNNPTGLAFDPDELRAFCRRVSRRVPILVDEAYNELTDDPERNSLMDLAREGENVIISRTFSKIYGMAGMRVGYMVTTPENVLRIAQHQMCWVAAPSIAAAIAAFDDHQFLAHSKAKIVEAREMVVAAVKASGLRHLPSQTNFLYVDVVHDANGFRLRMERKGILVQGIYRDYVQWSRVSMGHLQDVQRYIQALPEVLAS